MGRTPVSLFASAEAGATRAKRLSYRRGNPSRSNGLPSAGAPRADIKLQRRASDRHAKVTAGRVEIEIGPGPNYFGSGPTLPLDNVLLILKRTPLFRSMRESAQARERTEEQDAASLVNQRKHVSVGVRQKLQASCFSRGVTRRVASPIATWEQLAGKAFGLIVGKSEIISQLLRCRIPV